MSFTVCDYPQRSPEWFAARLGRVTGSCAAKILMGDKTAGRNDYIVQLALERMTGIPPEAGYTNADMQHGIDVEPLARIAIEARHQVLIRETGFIQHKSMMIGTSLDGDSDDFDCLYEFKCPKSTTHIGYLKAEVLPKDYQPQVMHALYTTGSKRCVFGSFDNRMPEGLDLFTVEVFAKDLPIEEYEKSLNKFLRDVENMVEELHQLQNFRKAA